MNPDTWLSWTLGITLLLWSPAAISMASGNLDILKSGLIFLAALIFSWIGTGVVSHIVETYRNNNQQVEMAKRQIEALEKRHEQQRRRASDAAEEEKAAE